MENIIKNSELDFIALTNVINKLQIYMDKHRQTLHGLATTLGFAYQPLYRLMTKKHMPTINSLGLIAKHFNCSIAELIDDDIFIDIKCFQSLNDSKLHIEHCRLYLPYQQYLDYLDNEFFLVKSFPLQNNAHHYSLFFYTKTIKIDGLYWCNYQGENTLLNILSISSKYIVIEENNHEVKINLELIQPIAKFCARVNLIENNKNTILGVVK